MKSLYESILDSDFTEKSAKHSALGRELFNIVKFRVSSFGNDKYTKGHRTLYKEWPLCSTKDIKTLYKLIRQEGSRMRSWGTKEEPKFNKRMGRFGRPYTSTEELKDYFNENKNGVLVACNGKDKVSFIYMVGEEGHILELRGRADVIAALTPDTVDALNRRDWWLSWVWDEITFGFQNFPAALHDSLVACEKLLLEFYKEHKWRP